VELVGLKFSKSERCNLGIVLSVFPEIVLLINEAIHLKKFPLNWPCKLILFFSDAK
jgi:hypothetical protein